MPFTVTYFRRISRSENVIAKITTRNLASVKLQGYNCVLVPRRAFSFRVYAFVSVLCRKRTFQPDLISFVLPRPFSRNY